MQRADPLCARARQRVYVRTCVRAGEGLRILTRKMVKVVHYLLPEARVKAVLLSVTKHCTMKAHGEWKYSSTH